MSPSQQRKFHSTVEWLSQKHRDSNLLNVVGFSPPDIPKERNNCDFTKEENLKESIMKNQHHWTKQHSRQQRPGKFATHDSDA